MLMCVRHRLVSTAASAWAWRAILFATALLVFMEHCVKRVSFFNITRNIKLITSSYQFLWSRSLRIQCNVCSTCRRLSMSMQRIYSRKKLFRRLEATWFHFSICLNDCSDRFVCERWLCKCLCSVWQERHLYFWVCQFYMHLLYTMGGQVLQHQWAVSKQIFHNGLSSKTFS